MRPIKTGSKWEALIASSDQLACEVSSVRNALDKHRDFKNVADAIEAGAVGAKISDGRDLMIFNSGMEYLRKKVEQALSVGLVRDEIDHMANLDALSLSIEVGRKTKGPTIVSRSQLWAVIRDRAGFPLGYLPFITWSMDAPQDRDEPMRFDVTFEVNDLVIAEKTP